MPGNEPELVSRYQMTSELERTVSKGGLALMGSAPGAAEFVAIKESGATTLYELGFPYFGVDVKQEKGLKLVGVMRRTKFLKRNLIECDFDSIKRGDKAVLEDEDGNRIKTLKLKSLEEFTDSF